MPACWKPQVLKGSEITLRKLPNLVLSSGADFPNSPVKLPSLVAMEPTSDVNDSIDELREKEMTYKMNGLGKSKSLDEWYGENANELTDSANELLDTSNDLIDTANFMKDCLVVFGGNLLT